MTGAWSNVTSIAEVMREAATKAAFALVDQLTSPLGHGVEEDTDIDPGSPHDRRRVCRVSASDRATTTSLRKFVQFRPRPLRRFLGGVRR